MTIQLNEYYDKLAKQFCPIFYLHSHEKYFPCSVEYVISHCKLIHNNTNLFEHISCTNTTERIDILSQCTDSTNRTQYNIHVAEHTRSGFLPTTLSHNNTTNHTVHNVQPSKIVSEDTVNVQTIVDDHNETHADIQPTINTTVHTNIDCSVALTLDNAPIYVQIRTADIDTATYIDIVYHVYCAYNGPLSILGKTIHRSAHDSDYEHCTLRINISDIHNPTLYAVYLSQHGDADGEWRLAQDMQYQHDTITNNKHVVIYLTKYGHSMHHAAGTYIVALCFANEYCDKGHQWYPINNIVMVTHNDDIYAIRWLNYLGKYAPSGIDALKCKSYWWHTEPTMSNSKLRRIVFANRVNYKWLFNNTLQSNV